MNKRLIVRQNGFKDCGPSCLLSIMRYYGCEASHEEVAYILKTSNDGTNAFNIINGARSFGFDGYGIHYSYDEIVNNKVSFPIICHILKNNMYHFIVVYSVNKDKLIVMDPSSEISKLSKEEFKKVYLNTSIVIYPVKKFQKITKHQELFSYLLEYIKLNKNSAYKTIIFSIIAILLGILSNYYIMLCIDYILPNYTHSNFIKLTLFFIIIIQMKNLFTFFKGKYLINIEKSISIKMNNDLIVKVFNLPYYFFKSKSTGEVMSRINDFKSFKNILIDLISNTFINIILVFISMIVLLFISTKLFFINFIGIVLYFIIIMLYRNVFLRKTENVLISEGNYNKLLHENICGYETNKNINMINDSIKNIEIGNIKYSNSIYSYENSLNNQILLKEIVINTIYIISIYFGIKYINNGTLTLGEFTLFNSVIYYFSDPIKEILDLEPNINYIKNIYNRINDLLIMKSNNQNDVCIDSIKGDIVIDNLSYSHDGINNTFNNVCMNIKYGSKFLIYGNSGIGKSTIMKIILKYLNEYKGDIYIGNINLKDINSETISNNMTYVSQKSFIFNDTLKNNIICDRNISMNDYEKVINICNLLDFRNSKPLRNNFLIEDDGFNISGGERQKIILARSLLKESNYIILDEALSEVGILEEKIIINKIFKHYKDKTIIYISHKPEIINMFESKFKLERRIG